MNIRMYSAAREATTKARNVASAIQQAQRQVNDDNKDISEKVDKNQQSRDKKKAEQELFSAKTQKDLAQKQLSLTQQQQVVATIQAVVGIIGAAVNIAQKINATQKPPKGEGDGENGGSAPKPKEIAPKGGGGGGGGGKPSVPAPPAIGGGGGGGKPSVPAPPAIGGGGGGGGGPLAAVKGVATGVVDKVKGAVTGAVDAAKGITGGSGGGGPNLGDLKGLQKGAGFASQGAQKGLSGGGLPGSEALSGAGGLVGKLQGALNGALDKLGISIPGAESGGKGSPLALDGKFGDKTEGALKAFQSAQGLDPSGKVDDATIGKLQSVLGSSPLGAVVPPPPPGGGTGAIVPPPPPGGGTGEVVPPPPGGGTGAIVPPPPPGGGTGEVVPPPPGGGGGGGPEQVINPNGEGGGIGDKLKGLGSGLLDKLKFATGVGLSDDKKAERQAAQADMKELAQLIEKLLEALGLQKATGGALGDISKKLGQIKDVVTKGEYIDDNGKRVEANALAKGINSAVVEPLSKIGKAATQAIAGAVGTVAAAGALAVATPFAAAGSALSGNSDGFKQIGDGYKRLVGAGGDKGGQGGPPGGGEAGLQTALDGLSQGGGISDANIAQFKEAAGKIFGGATTDDGQGGQRLLSGDEITGKINALLQGAQQGGAESLLKGAGIPGLGAITKGSDGGLSLDIGGKTLNLSKELVGQLAAGGGIAQQALGQVQNAVGQGFAAGAKLDVGGVLSAAVGAGQQAGALALSGPPTPGAQTPQTGGSTAVESGDPLAGIVAAGAQVTQLASGGINIGGTAPTPGRGGQTGGDASPVGGLNLTGDQAKLLGTLKQAGLDIGISQDGKISLGGKEISTAQLDGLQQLAGKGLDLGKIGLSVGDNGGISASLGPVQLGIGKDGAVSASIGTKDISLEQVGALAGLASKGVNLGQLGLGVNPAGEVTGALGALGLSIGKDGAVAAKVGSNAINAEQLGALQGLAAQGIDLSKASLSSGDGGKITANLGGISLSLGQDGGLSVSAGGQTQSFGKEQLGQLTSQIGQLAQLQGAGVNLGGLSVGAKGLSLSIGGDKGATVGFGADGKLSISAGGKTQEGVSLGDAKGALANLSTLASQGALSGNSGLSVSLGDTGGLQVGNAKGSIGLGDLSQQAVQGLAAVAGQGVNLANATLAATGTDAAKGLSINGTDAGALAQSTTALSQGGQNVVGQTVSDTGGQVGNISAAAQSVIGALVANGQSAKFENGSIVLGNGAKIGEDAINKLAGGITDGKANGTAQAVLGLAAKGVSIETLSLGAGLQNAGQTGDSITINGNVNLDSKSVGALLAGGDRGGAVTDAVKAATNLTSALTTAGQGATGGAITGVANISFDESNASGATQGIGLSIAAKQNGQTGPALALDGAAVKGLANGGTDAARGLAALANNLKGADGKDILSGAQRAAFSAVSLLQAAGLTDVASDGLGGFAGKLGGKDVSVDFEAAGQLSLGTTNGLVRGLTIGAQNSAANQVLAGIGNLKSQQAGGTDISGASVDLGGRISGITAPSTGGQSTATNGALTDVLKGVNLQGGSGSGSGQSVVGGLFAPLLQTGRELSDSVSGASNPIVGLFTGDNANASGAKNLPGQLVSKAAESIAAGITGNADFKKAVASGDLAGASKILEDNGLSKADISGILSAGRVTQSLNVSSGSLVSALKGQLSLSSTAGQDGGTNYSVTRTNSQNPSGVQVGSLSVDKTGGISGAGDLQDTGTNLNSGQLNNRKGLVADTINGFLRNSEENAGSSRIGLRVKASDIQLDAQGNLASIKVDGKSLSLDQFTQLYGQSRGFSASQTSGFGNGLGSAVTGAISNASAELQRGGSDNKIGAAVNQALASFKAAGTNTDGAKIDYGKDGNATITLANGNSIGVDKKGQLFSVNPPGPGSTGSQGGAQIPGAFGQQVTTTSANNGIISGQEANLERFLGGPEQLAKFTGNQDDANKLKAQIEKGFDQSLFSGRTGGDAFGAGLFGVLTLGLGEAALRASNAGQNVSKIDFTYDDKGKINGANVDFANGGKLSLGRNGDGQYNVRGYQSGTVDNSRGLLNFLNTQREGQVNKALGSLGATGISVNTRDNPNLPLSDPSKGQARPDGNRFNDGFAQESVVSLNLGGQKLDIGIDYDRNGGAFVNLDGLNGQQKGALQAAVQGKLAEALLGDQDLGILLSKGNSQAAQTRVNEILQQQGLGGVNLDVNQLVSGSGVQQGSQLKSLDELKAGTGPLAQSVSVQAALGSVRSALGGKEAQLTRDQFLQAEGDVIKSFKDSGLENVRFATTAIQELAGNSDFQALVAAGDTKGAEALLRQAEKESGLNQGVFQLSDITKAGPDGKPQAKSVDELKREFGSVDLNKGYDGRVSKVTANNITDIGNQKTRDAVEALTQNQDFQALATGTASSDVVDKYKKELGAGFENASQGQIAQALLDRSVRSTGVSPINSEGKALINVTDLLSKTETGKVSLKGAAGIKDVMDKAGLKGATTVGNVSIRQDTAGRRTVEATGAPEKLQENLKKNFPENEGPSKFKKTMDGVVKGLGESLPELMKALQALKKAMEDLQEAQIKLAAAKKQYNAALKYAAEMGITADLGGAGGGGGGGAGGVGAAGMAGPVQAAGPAEAGKGGGKGGGPEQAGKGGPEQAGKGGPEETGKGGATPTVDENGNPTTPGEVASELLSQVASDAGFANMSVLLGLQPGLLIAQAQQADMLENLTHVIKQLQSPNGDPIQEMQRFLDQLKQRTGIEATPPSDMIPLGG